MENLQQQLSSGEGEMCGGYPVLLAMMVARQFGATHGVLCGAAVERNAFGSQVDSFEVDLDIPAFMRRRLR